MTAIALAPAEPIDTGWIASVWRMRCRTAGGRVALTAIRKVPGTPAGAAPEVTVSVRYTTLPRAGNATAASVISGWPLEERRHSAMCTAQSSRPGVENSRVPSNGSIIHTRSDFSRARSSWASSLSTASPGRSACSRRNSSELAWRSPASPSVHG
ncbi:Uncharacterised protein [Mycobacterium tuberculosis]|nr:Uncharacterised protein [Mycobacterium tuberculosis]